MRDVRVTLDQNNSSDALIAIDDMDTLTLDEIIRSKVCEAVQRVESMAAPQFVDEGYIFGDESPAIYWGANESGWIILPEDFMRLVAFKMSDWEQILYSAISPADPLYAKQSSRYKGIRGNVQKPVCAIVNRPEGKVLEFYSCNSEEAYPVIATYRPYPKIENDSVDISERCYTAVVYMTAALVAATYGDNDKFTAMTELSKSMIQ